MQQQPVQQQSVRQEYVLRFADTALVASQRLCEWVGHAPELEEELALANLGLDMLGQARQLLSHAGSLTQPTLSEDDLAMHRAIGEFRNLSLVEQPNGDLGLSGVLDNNVRLPEGAGQTGEICDCRANCSLRRPISS